MLLDYRSHSWKLENCENYASTKKECNKWRPIACTSVLLKDLENIVLQNLMSEVHISDITQFAYRRSYSTLDAISTIVHFIASSLDAMKNAVRFCILDYTNAFNTVDRRLLIVHPKSHGASENRIGFLIDYFHGRRQYVQLNRKKSSQILNKAGVLQGSILSPYLFSFYASSLSKPDYSCMIKHANDIALGCGYSSHSSTLQFDLLHLIYRSTSINFNLNPLKCTDVLFTLLKACNLNDLLSELNNLHVDGVNIAHCSTVRYIGVTLSRDVRWTVHVENVFMKVKM